MATGSVTASLVLVLVLAGLVIVVAVALHVLGVGRDHPLVQPLATRPWRDGRDVLQVALRHLSDVFILTPGGSWLAPSAIDLCMNPADVESLADVIDLELVNLSVAEAYEAAVAARAARLRTDLPVEAVVVPDPAVPAGRYRIRQRRQRRQGAARPQAADRPAETTMTGTATICGPSQNPLLCLVTGKAIAHTRVSGARAGRGRGAELQLPDELTVSRVHAEFTCEAGEWRMVCVGRNGVVLNGAVLAGDGAVKDGDSIRWGRQADALTSRVEIR